MVEPNQQYPRPRDRRGSPPVGPTRGKEAVPQASPGPTRASSGGVPPVLGVGPAPRVRGPGGAVRPNTQVLVGKQALCGHNLAGVGERGGSGTGHGVRESRLHRRRNDRIVRRSRHRLRIVRPRMEEA